MLKLNVGPQLNCCHVNSTLETDHESQNMTKTYQYYPDNYPRQEKKCDDRMKQMVHPGSVQKEQCEKIELKALDTIGNYSK